jgi:hypothetical protein
LHSTVVGVGGLVECAASFITLVRPVSPIGSAAGDSGNLSTRLSNVARLAAHPKFLRVFNANYDGTIIYNDPVFLNKIGTNTILPQYSGEV